MRRVEHKPIEVRRHEIIGAAQKIILTREMGHLTIEAIAQEAGLTEGAIYRHFTSKQRSYFSSLFLGMVQGCVTAISSWATADQGLARWYLPLWNVYKEAVVSQ